MPNYFISSELLKPRVLVPAEAYSSQVVGLYLWLLSWSPHCVL